MNENSKKDIAMEDASFLEEEEEKEHQDSKQPYNFNKNGCGDQNSIDTST